MYATRYNARFPLAMITGVLAAAGLLFIVSQAINDSQTAQHPVQITPPIRLQTVREPPPVIVDTTPKPPPRPVAHNVPLIGPPTSTQSPLAPPGNFIPFGPDGPAIPGVGPNGIPFPLGGSSGLGIQVRIPPTYPPRAAFQGVEGTVRTCFTVAADGTVFNPRVVGASSPAARRLLGQAALQTISRWRFFPRELNGHAVATPDVCQNMVFKLH